MRRKTIVNDNCIGKKYCIYIVKALQMWIFENVSKVLENTSQYWLP